MKQMMFARSFPVGHDRAGAPTHFVEKIWAGLVADEAKADQMYWSSYPFKWQEFFGTHPKHHTIRAGKRWKVGDVFSPKIWSGLPYRSKTITFGPPLEVKKIWNIEIWPLWDVVIDGIPAGQIGDSSELILRLAKNDGLSEADMREWFSLTERLEGQIICWNEKIVYP